jgi:hypothetical protein
MKIGRTNAPEKYPCASAAWKKKCTNDAIPLEACSDYSPCYLNALFMRKQRQLPSRNNMKEAIDGGRGK